jgi:hypothetical protein
MLQFVVKELTNTLQDTCRYLRQRDFPSLCSCESTCGSTATVSLKVSLSHCQSPKAWQATANGAQRYKQVLLSNFIAIFGYMRANTIEGTPVSWAWSLWS